jgi:4-hydroxybenzoate polyprenyltransferase
MTAGRRSRARGWKAVVRRTPGGALLVQAVVLVAGLAFILLGFALVALPGPLTIPPILLGLWIWSTEFRWADRLFDRAKDSAHKALEEARRRPVLTGLVTGSGIVALVVGIYVSTRYQLVDRVLVLVGLG